MDRLSLHFGWQVSDCSTFSCCVNEISFLLMNDEYVRNIFISFQVMKRRKLALPLNVHTQALSLYINEPVFL